MKTVIEMAREAGVEFTYDPTETPPKTFVECWVEELERFAELVRADAIANEREACAKVCEEGVDTEHPIVKGHIMKDFGNSSFLAAAIRARGNT